MYTTINITPRAFGNIAARAITYGLDVSAYLVRTAITGGAVQGSTTPATGQHSPAPAGGAGQGTPAPSAQPEYTTETPNLTC